MQFKFNYLFCILTLLLLPVLLPFYGCYTQQLALASIPVKNWRILLAQCFTVRMPLLTATSTFTLERKWSCLHRLCILIWF